MYGGTITWAGLRILSIIWPSQLLSTVKGSTEHALVPMDYFGKLSPRSRMVAPFEDLWPSRETLEGSRSINDDVNPSSIASSSRAPLDMLKNPSSQKQRQQCCCVESMARPPVRSPVISGIQTGYPERELMNNDVVLITKATGLLSSESCEYFLCVWGGDLAKACHNTISTSEY